MVNFAKLYDRNITIKDYLELATISRYFSLSAMLDISVAYALYSSIRLAM
jgi:hypothetical protein